jgi:hypothetical protein
MAEVERSWTKTLAVAALLMSAVAACLAQSARAQSGLAGSLSGKLTDLHSNPLGGVLVVARNQATGAETRAITTKNGSYRFTGLEPGEYSLEAESPRLGHGHVDGIVVDAGYEAKVQAAVELEPLPRDASLAALRKTSQPRPEQEALPVRDAALAAEPLWTMPLSGRILESSAPSTFEASGRAGVNGSQVSEARPGPPGVKASVSGYVSVNDSQVSEARPGNH